MLLFAWVKRLGEREGKVFRTGAGFGGLLEGGVAAVERVFGLFAVEDLLDCQDLDARVAGAVGGFVESGFGGFAEHGFCRFLEAEEDSDFGFLAFEGSTQVADLRDGDTSGFYGEENLFGFAGLVVMEVEASVDAAVGSFFLLGGARADLT